MGYKSAIFLIVPPTHIAYYEQPPNYRNIVFVDNRFAKSETGHSRRREI
jgi:hypothetical protein